MARNLPNSKVNPGNDELSESAADRAAYRQDVATKLLGTKPGPGGIEYGRLLQKEADSKLDDLPG